MKGLITGIKNTRKSLLIYGQAGAGKSSLGAEFPKPVFIGTEVPYHLKVPKFPNVKTLDEFFKRCQQLLTEPNDRQTLVIDSMDGLQNMHIAEFFYPQKEKRDRTPAEYGGGYGRGNALIRKFFYQNFFMKLFRQLMEKYTVVFISHEGMKMKKSDLGEEISYFAPNLCSQLYDMVCDTVDCIVYVRMSRGKAHKGFQKRWKTPSQTKAEGEAIVTRELLLNGTEYVVAKNRWKIKEVIPYFEGQGGLALISAIKNYYKGVDGDKEEAENSKDDGDTQGTDEADGSGTVVHEDSTL